MAHNRCGARAGTLRRGQLSNRVNMGNVKPANSLRHGHCTDRKVSPTYSSWESMHSRVKNQARHAHATICDRWKRFDNFLEDMGERPEGKTLDRIDNAKGYNPDNCRWATPTEQCRNRSNTWLHNGIPVFVLCGEDRRFYQTVYARVKTYGWSVDDALSRPLRRRRPQQAA